MGERIDLASAYFRAIKITARTWGQLGMLAIHQVAIVDPLLKRARLTNGLVESLGFTPTDVQKAIMKDQDPVISHPDKNTPGCSSNKKPGRKPRTNCAWNRKA